MKEVKRILTFFTTERHTLLAESQRTEDTVTANRLRGICRRKYHVKFML